MDADINASERYEEIVGSNDVTPYTATSSLMVDCPDCGSPVGIRCEAPLTAVRPGVVGRRKRRVPCLARIKAAEAAP